jgi:hypothetical protein
VRERNSENAAAIVRPLGKSAEAWVRRLRPHFKPAYRKAYAALMARGLSQRKPGEPIVCCDFSQQAIDAVGGRYYFSLVLDLIDAGYFPVFVGHRVTLSTFGTSRVKQLLLDRRLGTVKSLDEIKEPFLLITDSNSSSSFATRTVKVDYTQRIQNAADEVAFPVFVHPRIAIKEQLPFKYDVNAVRPARIFFGGNTEEGKYDKNVIGEVYSMLTRREMLATVSSQVADIFRPANAIDWLKAPTPHSFVLCETQVSKIPPERWLEAMSQGDFFLACPGVGMPLCHNLIEAMAVGGVPILQYRRYLSPELQDGVNCLAFEDEASLKAVVARVLAMSHAEILKLRQGVKAYFDAHQSPGQFSRRLFAAEKNPTLLINAYRVPR